MANEENLVPLNQRTKEAAKEIQIAGGIARGKQQTEQKTMREWAKVFGAIPVKVKTPDGKEADTTTLGSIVAAQMAKATRGDTKAAKYISELLGETRGENGGLTLVVNASEEGKANIEAILKGEK